ncbi:HAD-IA family hydrolase [Paracoccus contaminans]|uniref:HAD family hydrolase n=1 Tax=Paracoccus contaminans TaxID=1945662 RepID=A0A1W6CVN8_9RHOB|nr:HAD-IA family hydrolase [Paracoccus contaminans]ARJ68911.1 HAD family hydrolase [Paracoccus contaminans]
MKLVIWDIDGTLVDSHAVIMDSMGAGMRAAGLPTLPDRAVSAIVGLSLPVAVETLLPDADEATRARVVDGYRAAYSAARVRNESPLFPGARDLLGRLAARDDVLMAVATGKSRRGLDALLAAHDLGGLFVTTQCADDHPSKPAPGMVIACLRAAGAAAGDAVMVGDTSFDMQMAANAGVAGIGVAWGHHGPDDLRAAGARAVAADMAGLGRLLDGVLG